MSDQRDLAAVLHQAFHEAWGGIGDPTEPLDLYPLSNIWLAQASAVLDAGAPAFVRSLARRCHNGAPDPWQEFYDVGLSPLLDLLAEALERSPRG